MLENAVDEPGHDVPAELIVSQEAVDAAPMIYTDGPVGIAFAGGVLRVTLGAELFNADSTAGIPKIKPVLNLILSEGAALELASALMGHLADEDDGSDRERRDSSQ